MRQRESLATTDAREANYGTFFGFIKLGRAERDVRDPMRMDGQARYDGAKRGQDSGRRRCEGPDDGRRADDGDAGCGMMSGCERTAETAASGIRDG